MAVRMWVAGKGSRTDGGEMGGVVGGRRKRAHGLVC